MKIFYITLIIIFLTTFSNAQTFSGKAGAISDNNTENLFDLNVDKIGNSSKDFGFESIQIDITHSWNSDLDIFLIAPDGTKVRLVQANGGSSQNYKNTIFNMSSKIKITDAYAPFTGTYLPENSNLGVFNNSKNLSGKWQLSITDTYSGNSGVLNNWSINFGNKPATSIAIAPPLCTSNVPAGVSCTLATPVCDLTGYCGNTSSFYAPPKVWPALTSAFCGSIDNNSFIKFVASATSATFNVWVYNSQNADGIQMMVYTTPTCGSGAVTKFGCENQIFPTGNGASSTPFIFTAGGPFASGASAPPLIPGNTYWLMFDGFSGDVCDYVVSSSAGVSIINVSPSLADTCTPGTAVTLTASGSSNYVWSPATGLNTTTGATVIASPLVTTTYSVIGTSVCIPKTVTITVGTFNINATPPAINFCSLGTPTYDLTFNIPSILGASNPADYDISFYHSLADANLGSPLIINPNAYQPTITNEIIYVRVEEISGGGCIKIASFPLTVCVPVPVPCPIASNSGPVCSNATFNLFANTAATGIIFAWTGPNGFTSNQQNPTNVPAPTGAAPYIYSLNCSGTVNCVATTTVTVNPTPNAGTANSTTIQETDFNIINLFSLLSGSPQSGGIWIRISGSGGIFNAIAGSFQADASTTPVSTFQYTVTNICGTSTSIVTVNRIIIPPPVILNNPTPLSICDDNAVADGIACFNASTLFLHSKDSEVTTNPTIIISYHITFTDAFLGANPIGGSAAAPISYCNINPFAQRIYVRGVNSLDPTKFATTVLDLIVNPRPLENLLLSPFELCNVNPDPAGSTFLVENFNLHNKDLDIINGQISISPIVVNYYDNQLDAVGDLTGNRLTNIYANTANPQTIYYNIRFDDTKCGTVGELILKVNPLPAIIFPAFPPYYLCETSTTSNGLEIFRLESQIRKVLGGQIGISVAFYQTFSGATTNTGLITNYLYQNITPYSQTIGIRLTDKITGCYSVSSMDLIVNPLPAPVAPTTPYTVCDTDQNGNFMIDLTTKTPSILQGALNTTITFYGTYDDAENDDVINQLPNPYNMLMPIQTVFVRAQNTLTGCYKIMSIILEVKLAPVLPLATPLADLVMCDEDNPGNNQDYFTKFDLTQQNAFLLSVQTSPASNFTISYYTSQANAEGSPVGISPIVYPTTFINTTNNQDIWVRIENNITKCISVTSFKLKVNIPLDLITPTPLKVCDDGPNPSSSYPKTVFDLTVKNNSLSSLVLPAGYTVTYYNTQAGSLAGTVSDKITTPTAYSNLVNPQTLGVVVTSDKGCRSYTTLTIETLPIPSPNTNPADLPAQCDDNIVLAPNNPVGFEYFNLTTNENYIKNGEPNVILRYFPTKVDAEAEPPTNEILTPTNALVSGDVFIRVESTIYTSSVPAKCYTLMTQKLKVNPLPTVSMLDASIYPGNQVQICQNFTATPVVLETFNLTGLIPELLLNNPFNIPATSPPTYSNTYTTTFYTSAGDALNGTNKIITPNAYVATTAVGTPQTIYVRVVNDQTGCVNAKGTFTIVVNPKPTITLPANPLTTCDKDGTNNGLFLYPLDVLEANILGASQPNTAFTVTFYNDESDARYSQNAISDKVNYFGYTHKLWIRVENNITHCFELDKSTQIVELIPEPIITTISNIHNTCFDYITDYPDRSLILTADNIIPAQGATPNTYQWFEGYS
ncbi:MAG: proprotein convertase P-domain-containing protein, partial [Flavobacterium sp.]|nr:proprotein convertase P-domain-containing protein [Flavobacterium sp.]